MIEKNTFYFEDFTVGDKHTVGEYLLEKDEMIAWALKWDPEPFHIDEDLAKKTVYGGLTASGSHVNAIMIWLVHRLPNKGNAIGLIASEGVQYPNPARLGDKLSLTNEALSKRESKTKPDRGIIRLKNTVFNQRCETVLEAVNLVMMHRRPE